MPGDIRDFLVKDSGVRQEFAGGMVRDTAADKTDFELILNGPMAERWAAHLTKGAKKYPDVAPGVPNWTLAEGQEELVRFRKSAMRHFIQWHRGDEDEDHAAAVIFNINGYEYVKAKMLAENEAEMRQQAVERKPPRCSNCTAVIEELEIEPLLDSLRGGNRK